MNFLDKYWDVAAKIRGKAARAEFIVAVVEHYYTGQEPKFRSEVAEVAFEGIRNLVDTSRKQSELGQRSRPAKREPNANQTLTKREPKANQTLTQEQEQELELKETSPDGEVKKAARKFEPPTEDEVAAYAAEKGLDVDPSRFCDYYAAQGWRLSNGVAMRDWRAAARNWSARGRREESGAVDLGAYAGAW